ncbi:SURP and G-patch domain-containing protein 1-like protein isoform X1 [Cryptomeria japonica]|uniref:SURP and G-patch domain-containing protein 1-like protein isoform X1 n=1 Tax=Cryptomeria japonica TaxID=3369 RepID=UPI0027DA59F6|nr:SURP and G-patch domain-containing protein 1-like protein isoform X1 [Cryptomeria japonica]XP_057814933.2 SURP and G-patch domain-containing protein 1-like protein isoform X1 [Cryptomeria japonica]XP_057814934.2 SURP and G-patch domain-containing protein 1-like protein isoform X1 [Cryptomeria japonica]XP_057814935.2 SURP and G-patch domain-containing protein 1-like protein isoform X1 [Cryptomeria japonica]XP_059076050.1 SURP and G-patch domain-containing protein 1-like protein isoform X1 [Cr
MEGESNSSLFANDGSFLERFKQLQQQQQQQQQQQDKEQTSSQSSKTDVSSESADAPKTSMVIKKASTFKPVVLSKAGATPANGKLAFSLKQKSKLAAAPVKLGGDEEDEDYSEDAKGQSGRAEKRQKLERSDNSENSHDAQQNAPPTPPNDPEVKKVADKLACFVAKNGRQFENITRQKNPGDTPFRFLFDFHCADYKYYEYRVAKEERALAQSNEPQNSYNASTSTVSSPQPNMQKRTHQGGKYQTPASALYDGRGEGNSGERSAEPPSSADPVAMMEYYMKKAAQEERRRPPKKTKDEMPPPPSLQGPPKKGHHMGDYIPNEELEKFLAACNDAAALKANKEATERAKIQADNVGHRLLSKMGWKEGEGLGSGKTGRADPVEAGNVKLNNLGVGASQPGEVTPEDDIYEQYKKRMMLGYRYRPNPLNNPRKAYY